MNWPGTGAIAMGLAVMLGAFGAHALRGRLDSYSLGVYEKAVFYHFIHAIGLLVVASMPKAGLLNAVAADRICWLLIAGILIFSGSLYTLSITGIRTLGAITPLGGIAFILAWFLLACHLFRGR